MLDDHRSKASPNWCRLQGDGLKVERCTSNVVDGFLRLEQRLLLQVHDHSAYMHLTAFMGPT